MWRILLIFAFILVLGALGEAPALAGYFDGNKLYSDCASEKGDAEYVRNLTECNGYIMGVVDASGTYSEWDKRIALCIADGVNTNQLRELVTAELKSKPSIRHYPASYFVLGVLSNAFPCKSPPTK